MRGTRNLLRHLLLVLPVLVAAPGAPAAATDSDPQVNVYSARKEALIKPLLNRFTEQSGIRVNLVTGKADALLKRLESEGTNTPADVLITVDAGRLHRAKTAGLLTPVSSAVLEQMIPPPYRDPDGLWFGLSLRLRPLMISRDRVDPAALSRYEDLADPAWRNKICVRSSDNIYNQSLVASMIAAHGEAGTEKWARGLVANFARPPRGGDRDQIKAVAAGECDIALANTYYLGRMENSKKQEERMAAASVFILWPNQQGRGAHVNVSGAGVVRYAPHPGNAVKLLVFLVSDEAQRFYADSNYEYPVRSGVKANDTLRAWGEFKAESLNVSVLGENNAAAVMLMDRAGWK
jgi:iron(III) transport system substrate-binding protein